MFDPLTRSHYFEVFLSIPAQELTKLQEQNVVNGMEVTAFIQTDPETPLQYVTRPIVDYFHLAFRDRS